MKIKHTLFAAIVLTIRLSAAQGATAQSAGDCTPVFPGLVSWWRGEGEAIDSIGTNHGTLVNGASYGPGLCGQGFLFDGVDDYVEIPHAPSLSFAAGSVCTIEFWLYRTSFTLPSHFLGKRHDCGPYGLNYQAAIDAGKIPMCTWIHWAQVYDIDSVSVFTNGDLFAQSPGPGFGDENEEP